uniref:Ribonuclease P protein component n=1 Tax=Lygus hesperus TaxID=30085 RepID=A0A0A9YAX1_LYGHE
MYVIPKSLQVREIDEVNFNFQDLIDKFVTICRDYDAPISAEKKCQALEFCVQVIKEIGPKSGKAKKEGKNQAWIMAFSDENTSSKLCIVTSNRHVPRINRNRYVPGKHLTITAKQAGMLAVRKFSELAQFALTTNPPTFVLTPAARIVFRKEIITKIAEEAGWELKDTVKFLNNSCQFGSQYFQPTEVRASIAAVATMRATRAVRDPGARRSIKTIQQYKDNHHDFNTQELLLMSRFATRGSQGEWLDAFVGEVQFLFEHAQMTERRTSQPTAESTSTQAPFSPKMDEFLADLKSRHSSLKREYDEAGPDLQIAILLEGADLGFRVDQTWDEQVAQVVTGVLP